MRALKPISQLLRQVESAPELLCRGQVPCHSDRFAARTTSVSGKMHIRRQQPLLIMMSMVCLNYTKECVQISSPQVYSEVQTCNLKTVLQASLRSRTMRKGYVVKGSRNFCGR